MLQLHYHNVTIDIILVIIIIIITIKQQFNVHHSYYQYYETQTAVLIHIYNSLKIWGFPFLSNPYWT